MDRANFCLSGVPRQASETSASDVGNRLQGVEYRGLVTNVYEDSYTAL
jgi:hypothetical protein